jgi:hypothetical protein
MKKITILLCALCLLGVAWWAQARTVMVVTGGVAPAGGCTASATMRQLTDDDYWGTDIDEAVTYQRVKNSASITICKVDFKLYTADASQTCNVSVWDSGNSSQIGADSDAVAIVVESTPGRVYSFTWSGTNPNPTADYNVHIFCGASSGSVKIRSKNDPIAYEDTTYDLFAGSADKNGDAYFQIYTE